jgi:5,10-methylenetetrahydromethanopterin reductase
MTPMTEAWIAGVGLPRSTVRQARRAEDEGWDGLGVVDSQNLAADPYAELALAASATSRIRLGTAVTNPITRHPAATAAAIATVHAESDGRAVLGIGRGDSSLAHLGLSPAPPSVFARYLHRLQAYLRGDEVPFDVEVDGRGRVASSDALEMAGGPAASRLRWLPPGLAKVPVDVAATGPKVIAVAARTADRITFAVGADPDRLRWAIAVARTARAEAGLDPDGLDLGAYLPLVVHADRARARTLVAGGVASFARFSVMHGEVAGPLDEAGRRTLVAVHDSYDMNRHFAHGSPQSGALTDDVIDAFGIAGPPSYCRERLLELTELGLARIFVLGGGLGIDRDDAQASRHALVEQVLPALR